MMTPERAGDTRIEAVLAMDIDTIAVIHLAEIASSKSLRCSGFFVKFNCDA